MAYTATLASVSTKLREGWAEWIKSGYGLLGQFRAMLLAHTHTGGVDGTLIPATGLTASSITATYLATGAVTSEKILDATIATGDLADDAVTTGKIADATIISSNLSTACKTHVSCTKWLVSSTAGDADLPVFVAPVACIISKAQLVTAAAVVGNATDYNNLYLEKWTNGVLGGTLASATSGTAGTWLAFQHKDLGTITGGTLAANDVLSVKKGTVAGGTAIADCLAQISWYATAV